MICRCLHEGPKWLAMRRFILHPFGVPLKSQNKPAARGPRRTGGGFDRLDDRVGAPGRRDEVLPDPVGMDGLVMKRVGRQHGPRCCARGTGDQTVRSEPDGMPERKVFFPIHPHGRWSLPGHAPGFIALSSAPPLPRLSYRPLILPVLPTVGQGRTALPRAPFRANILNQGAPPGN